MPCGDRLVWVTEKSRERRPQRGWAASYGAGVPFAMVQGVSHQMDSRRKDLFNGPEPSEGMEKK